MASGDAVDVDDIATKIIDSWCRDDLVDHCMPFPARDLALRSIEVMVSEFRFVAESIRSGASTRERAIELAVEIAGDGTTPDDVLEAAERFAVWIATGDSGLHDGDDGDHERQDAEPAGL